MLKPIREIKGDKEATDKPRKLNEIVIKDKNQKDNSKGIEK